MVVLTRSSALCLDLVDHPGLGELEFSDEANDENEIIGSDEEDSDEVEGLHALQNMQRLHIPSI
ncbi:hypothetical protein SARC_06738 [Sphaeroforma arctica JP610]|uniref:Uncharacterized protein n=1 Tax=Sphaeroforma arctica JP610 TaxID=667725 RepID=A0A0L0FVQ0_9EUKA|nr:hypothetical protein SARC_06738 [Sphaeroforma arctica JP610]KNC80917.1 hypothetical protein SARC_06738 [Sphaeroforma arctica JP610]|eukprot:XP_014154819.1 hypothetical protein SARC_06738 [Sphaeroforma arctica JP610]